GNQAGPAADTVAGITGAATVAVTAATSVHLLVAAPDSVLSGIPFDVTVTVQDAFGNTVMAYLGTVQFVSSDKDPGVILPLDYAFTSNDAGVHILGGAATLITIGYQTITVSDTGAAIAGGLINLVIHYT